MKICLACSAGGHFTEAIRIYEGLKEDAFFLTFPSENLKGRGEKIYTITDPRRNPLRFIAAVVQTTKVLLKEKPKVVVSTGAGVTVPACWLGKILGAKVVYIECGCRTSGPSATGKLVHPIADLFIVQWKDMMKFYKKAVYGGML